MEEKHDKIKSTKGGEILGMRRLGIIGVGSIGTLHIENIVVRKRCPNITITAVAHRREERRNWVRKLLPEAALFEDAGALIRSGLVDAVLNAFADCIEKRGELVADGREGINSLMLPNAIHLSGWTGEPVTLPIDEEKFLAPLDERRAAWHIKQVKTVGISDTNYDTL